MESNETSINRWMDEKKYIPEKEKEIMKFAENMDETGNFLC